MSEQEPSAVPSAVPSEVPAAPVPCVVCGIASFPQLMLRGGQDQETLACQHVGCIECLLQHLQKVSTINCALVNYNK